MSQLNWVTQTSKSSLIESAYCSQHLLHTWAEATDPCDSVFLNNNQTVCMLEKKGGIYAHARLSWHVQLHPTVPVSRGKLKYNETSVTNLHESKHAPESASSTTVNPSLQTFQCFSVTTSVILCLVNSSLP